MAKAAGAPPEYYGTRLATCVLIRRDGRACFVERDVWTLGADGEPVKGSPGDDRVFRFSLDLEGSQ